MNLRSSMSVSVSVSVSLSVCVCVSVSLSVCVCVCFCVCVGGSRCRCWRFAFFFASCRQPRPPAARSKIRTTGGSVCLSLSRVCSFKSCLSRELALTFFGPSIHPSKRAERVTTIESGWVWDAKIVGFQHIPAIFFVQFHVLTFVFFPFFSALVVPLFLISCA